MPHAVRGAVMRSGWPTALARQHLDAEGTAVELRPLVHDVRARQNMAASGLVTRNQRATKPASTGRLTPVMYLPSSLARNKIAFEMSTGETASTGMRFTAMLAARSFRAR